MNAYSSKIAQLIDETINDCMVYGQAKNTSDGLTVEAEWDQNGRDIMVSLWKDGRFLVDWLEKEVAKE